MEVSIFVIQGGEIHACPKKKNNCP